MSQRVIKCWICGRDAATGEHKTKRSDLRSVFGKPTQADPLYIHDATAKNRRIGGLDAKLLKSPSLICADCNNARTQPHDRAWERMSEALRSRKPPNKPGAIVRANRIFPQNTHRQLLNVHLYFVKLFGCHIAEATIPVDLNEFAAAIMQDRAHPDVYLKFACGPPFAGEPMTGMSNMLTANRTSDGQCAFATWCYYVDGLAINVMFAAKGEKRKGLVDAWHPRLGTTKLVIGDFTS